MRKWTLIFILSSISIPLSAQTLEMAVQHALVSNPDILQNKAKSLAAAEAVRRAEGAYMPTVDVKGSLGKEQTQTPITSAIGGAQSDDPMTRKETAIEINQNIFSGFALTGEAQRLFHAWRAQEFKTLGIAEDLVLDVTEKYLDVLRNQQLLMLARENLKEHQLIYNKIEERANAGLSRRAELEQARSRLSLAHANYLSVENDLRDAKVSFIRIVGQPAHHLTWPRVPTARDLPKSIQNAIQKGLDNHPTLLSAHADVLEAKAQHKVANAENYPKLDLFLDVRQNRNLDGLFGMNNEKLALVRLTYNVYRGGADLAKQRETAYQIQEAYELKNNTILQIEEKVRLSWYAWLTAGNRIHYLREHVDAALKTREAYIEQFKIGKRTLLDVVDSQNELYQAKIEAEQGHFDEVFTRYRILNAEGALFPFLKGRLPVSVHNSDFATSHERINHSWLDQPLASVPDVAIPGRELHDESLNEFKHPSTPKHKYFETTEPTKPLYRKTWFVYVKKYRTPVNALEMVKRLRALEMKANLSKAKGRDTWVYLGPFTYRSQAGLAMNRLQKRTNIKGSIAVRNQLVDINTQIIGQRKLKGLLRAVTLSKDDATIPQILIENDGTQTKTSQIDKKDYNQIPSPVAPSDRPTLRYLHSPSPTAKPKKSLPAPPSFKSNKDNQPKRTKQSKLSTKPSEHTPLSFTVLKQFQSDFLKELNKPLNLSTVTITPPLKLPILKTEKVLSKPGTSGGRFSNITKRLSRYFPINIIRQNSKSTTPNMQTDQSSNQSKPHKKHYRLSLNSLRTQSSLSKRSHIKNQAVSVKHHEKHSEVRSSIVSFSSIYSNTINQLLGTTSSPLVFLNKDANTVKRIKLSTIPTNNLFEESKKSTHAKISIPNEHKPTKVTHKYSHLRKKQVQTIKSTKQNTKTHNPRVHQQKWVKAKPLPKRLQKQLHEHSSNQAPHPHSTPQKNVIKHSAKLKKNMTRKKLSRHVMKNRPKQSQKPVHVFLAPIHEPEFYSVG